MAIWSECWKAYKWGIPKFHLGHLAKNPGPSLKTTPIICSAYLLDCSISHSITIYQLLVGRAWPRPFAPNHMKTFRLIRLYTNYKEPPLDPRQISGTLLKKKRASADFEKLLNFMSDDYESKHLKPSTRDRVTSSGKRVFKPDFEVESLLLYTNIDNGSHNTYSKSQSHLTKNDISTLDQTLEAARKANMNRENAVYKLEKSYNKSLYDRLNRKLRSKTFFTPVRDPHSKLDDDVGKEFIILTSDQRQIKTRYMPVHTKSPSDLFNVLINLKNPEKFIKAITRLEAKDWKLIGGTPDFLIYERVFSKKKRNSQLILNLLFGSAASVTVLLTTFLAISSLT